MFSTASNYQFHIESQLKKSKENFEARGLNNFELKSWRKRSILFYLILNFKNGRIFNKLYLILTNLECDKM